MATNEKYPTHSNFIAAPRWIFDEVLPVNGLPAPFFRVLLFLVRKTIGWQKVSDFISLSQIERGANVSRRYAQAGLTFWTDIGVVQVEAVGKRRMNKIRLTELAGDEIRGRIHAWLSQRRSDRLVTTGN